VLLGEGHVSDRLVMNVFLGTLEDGDVLIWS
jgi:hypothetical protein